MIFLKRILGIIIYTVVTCAILIHAPMEAKANAMPLQELDPYGDASMTISVSAEQVGATAWDFQYAVSAVTRSLRYFSIGFGGYTIAGVDYPVAPPTAFDPVTNNSFFPYFVPIPLAQGSAPYEFTIHFSDNAIFDGGQNISVSDVQGETASLTAYYDEPVNEVISNISNHDIPEPATLFLLGTGILILGLKRSRRKREA
jgi:hypothetical protein